MSKKLDHSNPITSRANMLSSFFVGDSGVMTKLYFYASKLKIFVQDPEQAEALASIIRKTHKLGNLHLDVIVYELMGKSKSGKLLWSEVNVPKARGSRAVCEAIDRAFLCNPNYAGIVTAKDPRGILWYFALMEKTVCQYLNDDIQNPWSTTSALSEDVLKKLITHKGVQISTVANLRKNKRYR